MSQTFTIFGRWFGVGVYYGPPPGTHKGFWVTNKPPMYGWNLRLGPYKHSLTIFIHTRKAG